MRITAVSIMTLALLLAAPALAQDDWRTKDVDRWTLEDVRTILDNSPWVKSQEVRLSREATRTVAAGSYHPGVVDPGGFSANASTRAAGNTISQGGIQPAVDFTFTLRLRSSMAVRLALIRQAQLSTDVDRLSEQEYAEFRDKLVGLYECPACAENYVVTLGSGSRENRNYDPVFTAFAQARIAEISKYIYLRNDRGDKRELVHFVPPKAPGDEAVFFFRRYDEDRQPLFTKESKHLIFNTTKNEVNIFTNFRMEIPPLIVGDKVDF